MNHSPFGSLGEMLAARSVRRFERDDTMGEAAVAVVLRWRDEAELLLIERAQRSNDPWSGHIALPGGRRQVEDVDLRATAERETLEEVALDLSAGERWLGALDEVRPNTRRLPPLVIAPYVALAPAEATLRPDPREVASIHWVALAELRRGSAQSEVRIPFGDSDLYFPSFRFQGHEIWGLTHRILVQLLGLMD
ncbi:MAG: CoA pyrophosphatase [Acidobacteriota bacterium]